MTAKTPVFIVSATLMLLSASCAIAPRDTGSAFMFDLPAATQKQAARAQGDKTLIVAMPQAAAELDTYRIALKKGDRRWDYYAGARWSDFLPVVVQDDLTTTLAKTHIFKSVATDESGLDGDRVLNTTLQAFEADYAFGGTAPVVRIRLDVRLAGYPEGRQIAAFTVTAAKEAAADTLSAIQAAFAAAWRDAERQIVAKLETERPKDQ